MMTPDLARAAGIHWPNGAAGTSDDDFGGDLVKVPGHATVIGAESARWHYWKLKDLKWDWLVVWRAIPLPEFLPEDLGWDARRYVEHILSQVEDGERRSGRRLGTGDYFCPWNEGNLKYERTRHSKGQERDIGDDWDRAILPGRYTEISRFLIDVAHRLRQARPGMQLVYPAWAPSQHWQDYVDEWRESVYAYDVLGFHSYGDADTVLGTYYWYREVFPNMPLLLTEWHGRSRDDVGQEHETITRLARWMTADPLLLGAVFFIWKWWDGGHGSIDDWDIVGNPERLALFSDPPIHIPEPAGPVPEPEPIIVVEPEPVPEPTPIPVPQEVLTMITVAEAHERRWRLLNPEAMYVHEWGLESAWRQPENAWWGSPTEATQFTIIDVDGSIYEARVFANAVVGWVDGKAVVLR